MQPDRISSFKGRRHLHFSLSLCLVQAIEATIIATAAFYVAIKSFPFVTHTPVYFGEGILTFTLLVVLNKLCIMTHHYTAIFLSVVLGFGILGWFLFLFFVSSQVWSSPEIMGPWYSLLSGHSTLEGTH